MCSRSRHFPHGRVANCSGFTFTYGMNIASFLIIPPMCVSTMVEGDFVYHSCAADGSSELRTVAVGGARENTLRRTWTRVVEETAVVQDGPARTWVVGASTITGVSTIRTEAPRGASTVAPVVQLVWRREDRPPTPDPSPTAATSPAVDPSWLGAEQPGRPAIPMAAIAGIAAGGVVLIVLAALGILIWAWRCRKREAGENDMHGGASQDGHATTCDAADTATLPPMGYKAELDAIATAKGNGQSAEKPELPGEGIQVNPDTITAEPVANVTTHEPFERQDTQVCELDAVPRSPRCPPACAATTPPQVYELEAGQLAPRCPAQSAAELEGTATQCSPSPVSPLTDQSTQGASLKQTPSSSVWLSTAGGGWC